MADNQQSQSSPGATSNTFSKGMLKDYNDTFVGEGLYTHARNAVNNSHDGQMGVIGNEPSNLLCYTFQWTVIGVIHLSDDQWAVFTTDDTNCEIGIFDESACSYNPVLTDPCLGFKRTNLITGTFRKRYDCERIIYWDDSLNPTRTMDVDNPIQYHKYIDTFVNNCKVRTYLPAVNCETLRLAPLIKHPCLTISRGLVAGTMPNGTYQACIAYTINQVKITDYVGLTAPQGLFTHENTSSALQLTITEIDKSFDEFELVILANVNAQTVAKRIGYYSTSQGSIYIDRWNTEYPVVNVGDVVVRTEPIEKSDAMYPTNNYLLRVGTYSKFKFNYQPIANNIKVRWQAVQYPEDYYDKSNHNTGYMRDEVYAFFIRFVYNTGEFSESYHIPGRAPLPSDRANITGGDAFETIAGPNNPTPVTRETWQVVNTGIVVSQPNTTPPELNGGVLIATGETAYWESTERYPDNRLDIWGNLCGFPIRHHKMPDETVSPLLSTQRNNGANMVLLGVQFSNIAPPVDNQGNVIQSVVGYEILRGSREGNKSIIAKGLMNNMREYTIPGSTVKGLFQNYPYNDLANDVYINGISTIRDTFSFHGPDVTFSNPYLNPNEIKVYEERYGRSAGEFVVPYKHPKFKFLTNFASIAATVIVAAIGVAQTALALAGSYVPLEVSATEDIPVTSSLTGQAPTSFSIAAATIPEPVTYAGIIASQLANTAVVAAMAILGAEIRQEQILRLFTALIPKVQFARQYVSYGFYNQSAPNTRIGNIRKRVLQSIYTGSSLQQFTTDYTINNINRSKVVAIKTDGNILDPISKTDTSRIIDKTLRVNFYRDIISYYGGLKLSAPGQYGQLDSIKQLPVSTCLTPITDTFTPILFGGDIYINRFTEKNSMFFFSSWLMGEPDLAVFDYQDYFSIPGVKYWTDSREVTGGLFINAQNFRNLYQQTLVFTQIALDGGAFYLFNSGVRDFFVESEVNVAYRDWEEDAARRHYDPYRFTDLNLMFRSDIVQSGNYYKYDYALSISKLFASHISWGELLPRDYNPVVAANCYTYRPNRVIYSLPQQDQSKKDNWRVYLANNYKDFQSRVSCIKPINKTGSLFMMAYQSPMSFMGLEELKVDGTGAKITIGDGGLFQQPMQAVTNVDESFEYGSNQGRYCSINTVHGVFWVSQNQGKIFLYANQLKEVSAAAGMRWWFARYLPSELLKVYPTYALYDNPVKGVGVQMMYDNTYDIIYITKTDYLPLNPNLQLNTANNEFALNGTPIALTNTNYFKPASWTASYDCKSETWISFHDWIPSFLVPGKNHFMSVNQTSIWKHNIRCDSYCNYYGVDYPFEIEFISATGQSVNSMRSIEYLLEVYNIYNDCRDKFHVLDQNFDQAVIYNSEQISGILQLNIKTKNNPLDMLTYPRINNSPNYIDIQFSKEENKYRFNQFWDITNDRGEYTGVSIPMFNTEPNGYIYPINPTYVNYNKPILQRKKFRHNTNKVFLRKAHSGNNKFLFKISNQKLLQSPR